MRRPSGTALLVLALAGCGFDVPPPSAPASPVAQAPRPGPAPVDEVPDDAVHSLVAPLLEGGRGELRFDRIGQGQGGDVQRQAYVELIGVGVEEAAATATATLEAQGFTRVHAEVGPERIRLRFEREGEAAVHVLARSRAFHPKLRRDDATSSLYAFQSAAR